MYSPGSPYIVVAPVVTSWAVAGQRMVFFHMFLQARVTLEAFPIVAPRGRSSKFPWRGTTIHFIFVTLKDLVFIIGKLFWLHWSDKIVKPTWQRSMIKSWNRDISKTNCDMIFLPYRPPLLITQHLLRAASYTWGQSITLFKGEVHALMSSKGLIAALITFMPLIRLLYVVCGNKWFYRFDWNNNAITDTLNQCFKQQQQQKSWSI